MLTDSNAIVDSTAFTTIDPNYATSTFFDEQLTALASVYNPEKTCYSYVSLLDSCGLVKGAHLVSVYNIMKSLQVQLEDNNNTHVSV